MRRETHNTEYKQAWQDDHLKTVCAFANSFGGTLYLGKDDEGNIKGLAHAKKYLEEIPNKIKDVLGFIPEVRHKKENGKEIITIKVKPQQSPVSLRGKFYVRSGSTTQELRGNQLKRFLLDKDDLSWDATPEEEATLKDIDMNAVSHFKELAIKRFPEASKEKSISHLLEKLELYNKGKLARAAILLFGKYPQEFYSNAVFRIGRFKDAATLLSNDEIKGNLFQQVEDAMDTLKKKYLHANVKIEGLAREEELEYPEEALREAVINAVVHRDYLENDIQLKVYPDELSLWNPGGLIGDLTIEKLKKKHASYRRNKLIAEVFYKAGYIEKWGTGTVKMVDKCKDAGLPEPLYEETQQGIQVTFQKDIYTEDYLKKSGLNERQIKAVLYAKTEGSITNNIYRSLNDIGKSVAHSELQKLLNEGILDRIGDTGRGTKYILKRNVR